MPDERATRLAENESRFREINDRVERDLERVVYTPGELLPFVCECAQRTCSATIELSRDEYERVRADSAMFAIAPGHEITDVEDVIERHAGYYVIRKHPETWEIVERTDPRRSSTDARRIALDRLIDDAGLFPPARKPMERAVADHRAARAGPHAWLLGRFLCPVERLGELAEAGVEPDWRLGAIGSVVAYDGPGTVDAIELRWAGEFPDAPPGVDVFVEAPVDALDAIAADGRAGAKIRCGGLSADAFPSDEAVAQFISECVRLALPFKATAGLHHPFRTRAEEIGVLQHGFVNLLAATALPDADTVAVIAEADPGAFSLSASGLRWRELVAGPEELVRARSLFRAYGSCSFDEPVADLVAHGIVERAPARA